MEKLREKRRSSAEERSKANWSAATKPISAAIKFSQQHYTHVLLFVAALTSHLRYSVMRAHEPID